MATLGTELLFLRQLAPALKRDIKTIDRQTINTNHLRLSSSSHIARELTMTRSGLALLVAALLVASASAIPSAAEVAQDIFYSCLSDLSTSCVKPKALSWLSSVVKESEIKITDDLSIIRTAEDEPISAEEQRGGAQLFDQIDGFLATHSVRVNPPAILKTAEARAFGSDDLGLDKSLEVPLAETNAVEGKELKLKKYF